jgi:hypothetical protein
MSYDPAIALRVIVAASLVLDVLGVWWGLPGKWVPIELLPEYVMGGLSQHFSHGWFDAYPPLHYFVLTVAMSPFMALSWCCGISLDDSYTRMVLVNRLVSVAAGAGIVAAACAAFRALGRRHHGPDDPVRLLRQDRECGRPVSFLVLAVAGVLPARAEGRTAPRLCSLRSVCDLLGLYEGPGIRPVRTRANSDRRRDLADEPS